MNLEAFVGPEYFPFAGFVLFFPPSSIMIFLNFTSGTSCMAQDQIVCSSGQERFREQQDKKRLCLVTVNT